MFMSEQSRLDQDYLANNVATCGHARVQLLIRLGQDIKNIKMGISHFENIGNSKHNLQHQTRPAVKSSNVRTGLKSILL